MQFSIFWLLIISLIGSTISILSLFLIVYQLPSAASLSIPLKNNNPSVKSTKIVNTFSGQITKLDNSPNGIMIKTNINLNNLPEFIVCLTCKVPTKIYKLENSNFVETPPSSLSVGQQIEITSIYDLSSKLWATTQVVISAIPAK